MLLRSLVAPVLLVATVIFSYAAALGAGAFAVSHILGYAGEDPSLILFSFPFRVVRGCDYSIFLMARAREESAALVPARVMDLDKRVWWPSALSGRRGSE